MVSRTQKITDITLVFDTNGNAAKMYGISYGAGAVFINKNSIVSRRFPAGFNESELLRETHRIVK